MKLQRSMMKTLRSVTVAIGLLATPMMAYAQACVGTPIAGGQYALEGGLGVGEGFKSYSGAVTANTVGPLSFNAGAALSKPDGGGDDITTLGVSGAYELTQLGRISACPTVGFAYSVLPGIELYGSEVKFNQMVVSGGFGLGTSLPAGSMNLTLFAVPQFLWYRTTASGEGDSESVTQNEFGLSTGLRAGVSSFYAGAGMSMTSVEDSDPVFNFGIGFVLGGRR
jgi:hypothetical protein